MANNDNPYMEHVEEVEELKDELYTLKLDLQYFAGALACAARMAEHGSVNIMDTPVFAYIQGFKAAIRIVCSNFEDNFGDNPMSYATKGLHVCDNESGSENDERHDEEDH